MAVGTKGTEGTEDKGPPGTASFDAGEVKRLVVVGIAIFAAILIIFSLWGGEKTKFEELGLGQFTTSVFGTYQGDPIHCRDVTDADACFKPAAARSLTKSVLWLGNSQVHGINNFKPGQQPASTFLANEWRPRGVEVLTFSQPNASLREHYVLFEYLQSKRRFDILLLPLVFDDTREGAIRQDVAIALDDNDVRRQLALTDAGRSIIKRIGSSAGPNEKQKRGKNLQDQGEEMITAALETCCGWKTLRKEAKGSIYNAIYRTRNRLLGIDPTTQRRRLPVTYQSNMDALKAIVLRAQEQKVRLIAYIAPLRSDVTPPYNPSEYAEFKQSVTDIVRQGGAKFLDLQDIVPGKNWGQEGTEGTGEGLDFMHFQHQGHLLLGQALSSAIEEAMK